MLKLELNHEFRKRADGLTDYGSPMVEFDYSHLGEERRDVVTREFEYEGKINTISRTYVSFGRGLTLEYRSTYIGDGDSVGAVAVWDPIEKIPVWFGLGYEMMARNPHEIIEYDATPEVKAEYDAFKAEAEKKRKEEERKYQQYLDEQRAAAEAATPRKGKRIRVIKGRKVAKGTVGYSFWYGQTAFGYRVGLLKDDGTKVFTAADNVEVIKDNLVYLEKKYVESLEKTAK